MQQSDAHTLPHGILFFCDTNGVVVNREHYSIGSRFKNRYKTACLFKYGDNAY